MSEPKIAFDPNKHLMKISGKDYLPVAWRLAWLRDVHPDATLVTELIEHEYGKYAVFKATATIPAMGGGGSASAYGTESLSDHREYFEKAETKAVGRALGALGFGTQFSGDFDEAPGVSGGIADSPIEFASTKGRRLPSGATLQSSSGASEGTTVRQTATNQGPVLTEKQAFFLLKSGEEYGLDAAQIDDVLITQFGSPREALGKGHASALIGKIKAGENVWAPMLELAEKEAAERTYGKPMPESAPETGGIKPMSDEAKKAWLVKIGSAAGEDELTKMYDTIVDRHGAVQDELAEAIDARLFALEGGDGVPY